MIISSFHPAIGGSEVQAQRISKAFIESGQTVYVLTRRFGERLPQGLTPNDSLHGIPIVRLSSRGPKKLGSLTFLVLGLYYLLRFGRRDIYHAHSSGAPAWIAVLAARLLKGHSIIKLRGGRCHYEEQLSTKWRQWLLITQCRLADHIIVVNSDVEKLLKEHLRIPDKRISRIPNAVDASKYSPVTEDKKKNIRTKLNYPINKLIALSVGRLEHVKGSDILLRAWSRLDLETRANSLLLLVGDGGDRDRLIKLLPSLEIAESVVLVGAQENVADYYTLADFFLLPSRMEGFSNALLEAMASGLPVLASDTGGAKDLIQAGINGLLFPSGNDEQLTEKIELMLSIQDHWALMGDNARRTVIEYADLKQVAEQVNDLYRKLSQ
jgi:glycosyltransferase involved in cell wall biosynthesis